METIKFYNTMFNERWVDENGFAAQYNRESIIIINIIKALGWLFSCAVQVLLHLILYADDRDAQFPLWIVLILLLF